MENRIGIDISQHNGDVDFKKLKDAGISFVIIRSSIGFSKDTYLEKNVKGCIDNGIDFGFYHYLKSYIINEAKAEAEFFLNTISSYSPTYPIYLDFEFETILQVLDVSQQKEVIFAFNNILESKKYYTGIYASKSVLSTLGNAITNRYDVWCASWKKKMPDYIKEKPMSCGMWQFTVVGKIGTLGVHYQIEGEVPGVSTPCDLNYSYRDYPKIIKENGLNKSNSNLNYKELYEETLIKLSNISKAYTNLTKELLDLINKYI